MDANGPERKKYEHDKSGKQHVFKTEVGPGTSFCI